MSSTLKWMRTIVRHRHLSKDPNRPPLSSALTIPEIILCIAFFLDRPSLARCSQVNRHWNAIFQPLLFRFIASTDFDRPDFVRAFQDNARYATSIEWIQVPPLTNKSPSGTHAWHRIFRKKVKQPTEKQFEHLENTLLAQDTPALESLSIRLQNQDPNIILRLTASTVLNLRISARGFIAQSPTILIEDILLAYPHLVQLTLEGLFALSTRIHDPPSSSSSAAAAVTTDAVSVSIPVSFTPTMMVAEDTLSDQWAGPSSSSSMAVATMSTSTTPSLRIKPSAIQALNLRLVDISQQTLLSLAKIMPQLNSLLIEEFLVPEMMTKIYRWTWSSAFIRSMKESFPHLRILRLAIPFDAIKEDTIIEILQSFPLLTTVGFRNSFFGRRALEALQTHCKFVDCLDVSFGYIYLEFKAAMLRFLQSWPQLRELEVDGMIFHLDGPEDEEVQLLPWACTKLEKLICGFQGTETMIFQHLAQFPLLKNLTITCPPLNLSPVENTLGWMSRSTRIQYFWFNQHRHLQLEKRTVEWMISHWLHLRTLHVIGGMPIQRAMVSQWFRDAHRSQVQVEYGRL